MAMQSTEPIAKSQRVFMMFISTGNEPNECGSEFGTRNGTKAHASSQRNGLGYAHHREVLSNGYMIVEKVPRRQTIFTFRFE